MDTTKNILFIAHFYPERAPSQRFRFEQYLDYFESKGYHCTLSNIIDPENDKIFYAKGRFLKKLRLLYKFYRKRQKDVKNAQNYNIVFVQREAHYLGTVAIERKLALKSKLIFDFDDSIWLMHVSDANKRFNWLKNPKKTRRIIAMADHVIAGNQYLADYAQIYNPHTTVIPTTIDTEYHKPIKEKPVKDKICIGWTGSMTTIRHFDTIVPVLAKLKEKYGNKLYFKVIGDENCHYPELEIQGIKWSLDSEIEDLREIDIGIMPLPDNEWAKGKCGLKGLQYMALEIPAVMSPVGVNKEIIEDGKNGFLCKTEEEWIDRLSRLIENPDLRKQIGAEGRKTVLEKYSKQAWEEKYVEVFEQML